MHRSTTNDINKYKPPVSKLHGDGAAAPLISPESYRVVFEKSSLYLTSPMKISKSKCNRKTPTNPFNFHSIKNSSWVHKVSGIKILFPKFSQKVIEWFLKKVHFTSPPLRKFLSPNVTVKPQKIHLILTQSKIPFECTKSLALGCYSQDFTQNYRVVFEKRSLYFTSRMKISKSKSNNKTPQNPFNFDSIKNSFWVHIDTGIRMLFTKCYKKLSS